MFEERFFEYYEKKHLGTYQGHLVPSITQLLDVLFPLNSEIPQDRLEKAAKRGTDRHSEIERVNDMMNVKHIIPSGCQDNTTQETKDYLGLINAFSLRPICYEELVFLLDENGELICYGHFDLVVGAYKDIEPFEKDKAYMCDIKTTSVFDKEKTSWQTHAYRVALKQKGIMLNLANKTFGIHLREGVKLIPLKDRTDEQVLSQFKLLSNVWRERNATTTN